MMTKFPPTILFALAGCLTAAGGPELYQAPGPDTHTRWISSESRTGAKGAGGQSNRGGKGNAFIVVPPGTTEVLADIKGAGIIHRMWLSGTIPRSDEQRRLVRFEINWDNATKPAVAAPIGDFFGAPLGLAVPFENALFANPEGRSFNFTIPMPFRTRARVQLVNDTEAHLLVWYDINYTTVKQHADDVMYFHAAWRRELKTELGRDFVILPKVIGKGRYLGANIGVIGGEAYRGTWFGEGEVKVYLDGDTDWPTLVGTGTEDYIGTGWGQGEFQGRQAGSLLSDKENDLYAFYRYHLSDPVYFHEDCRVTIQQLGNTSGDNLRRMLANGAEAQPVFVQDFNGENIFNLTGQPPTLHRLLEWTNVPPIDDPAFPRGGVHYRRRDDVSATVYFYLDRPENNLPPLASAELRIADMPEKVWSKVKGRK